MSRTVSRVGQRGMTESVQLALIWPLLLLVTLGIIQAGLWVHGRQVALRAATAAADVAGGRDGSAGAARGVAVGIAHSAGLAAVEVEVNSSPTEVRVVVSGRTPALLELPLGRISESAAGPRERVTVP